VLRARELPQPDCAPSFFERRNFKAVGEVVWAAAFSLTRTIRNREGHTMQQQRLHWLDYDPVAFAVLVTGMGMIALLALSI
jgi:hypothetical protein